MLEIYLIIYYNIATESLKNMYTFHFYATVPHQPRFDVRQAKSPFGIPSIDITFSNGVKDSLVLERFYPSEQSRIERKPSCNFFGHLENEKSACVSVTGCAGQDDMAFTINSRNGASTNMYILHKDGHLELVESPFKVQYIYLHSYPLLSSN